jgi:hypothetical protein
MLGAIPALSRPEFQRSVIKYEDEHKAGNTESAYQGDSSQRRTPVLKKLKAVFQTPKVKRSNKNVTMTKRCGAKTDFTNHEAIHDEIE